MPGTTEFPRPDGARPQLFIILDIAAQAWGSFPWENADNFFHHIKLRTMATSSVLWKKERRKERTTTKCINIWTSPSKWDDAWVNIRFGLPTELFRIFGFFELPPAKSTQVLSYFDWQALQKNHFFAQLVETSQRRQREEKKNTWSKHKLCRSERLGTSRTFISPFALEENVLCIFVIAY